MDETKETKQDASSAGGDGTTSKETTRTYTEEEKQKAVSDALAKAGRDAKTLETREAALNAEKEAVETAKAEIAEVQKQIDKAELEAAEGDPARLRELQAKKSYKALLADLETKKKELNKQEADLNRSKAEHESEIEAARKTQFEIELWKIAEAEGVDAAELKETMKELNLTTVEQAKAAAKRLNKKPSGTAFDPDSGVTSGGATLPNRAKDKIKAGWEEIHK